MRQLPHIVRVLLAAAAAGAAAFAATSPLTAAAQGAGGLGTSRAAASATPCPTGSLPGLICTIGGGPTASPTPSPSRSASPAPTGSPSGAPSNSAPGQASTPGKPPPSASASPPASPAPQATLTALAARFQNAPFLAELLDVLAHPASADQPDLLHFRMPGAEPPAIGASGAGLPLTSAADPQPVGQPSRAPGHRGWSVAAAILAGLVAAALVAARTPGGRVVRQRLDARLCRMRRYPATRTSRLGLRTSRGGRLQAAVVLAACPAIVAFAVAGAVGPMRPVAVAQPTHPFDIVDTGVGRADVIDSTAQAATAGGLAVWNQLVAIELGIADQQDTLARQETDLGHLARLAAAASVDDAVSPPRHNVSLVDVQQRIATLLAAHDQTSGQLHTALQSEYDLYRSAAQDPGQKQQLLAGAAKATTPDAQQAVAGDLARIQTQLSQEQVIAAARAKLARIGSLTQKQLDAIQAHQAFVAPEVAPISQPFGPSSFSMEPPLNFGGVFYPHFHTGVDIADALGTPVHAAADGVVIVATASTDSQGHLVGYGNYVVVAHPAGFITLYGHLSSLAVKAGQVVHQGEIIGNEGSTGWSTGPHLHFEIRLGEALLDPLQYLKGQLG